LLTKNLSLFSFPQCLVSACLLISFEYFMCFAPTDCSVMLLEPIFQRRAHHVAQGQGNSGK